MEYLFSSSLFLPFLHVPPPSTPLSDDSLPQQGEQPITAQPVPYGQQHYQYGGQQQVRREGEREGWAGGALCMSVSAWACPSVAWRCRQPFYASRCFLISIFHSSLPPSLARSRPPYPPAPFRSWWRLSIPACPCTSSALAAARPLPPSSVPRSTAAPSSGTSCSVFGSSPLLIHTEPEVCS